MTLLKTYKTLPLELARGEGDAVDGVPGSEVQAVENEGVGSLPAQ